MPVTGRRLADVRFGEIPEDHRPGDIWRYLNGVEHNVWSEV